MSEPSSSRAPLSLEASARRIGHYCWIEMQAFEILGEWAAAVPQAAVKGALATHSRQHGWHAEVWHDLLPVIGETGVDSFIAPASPALVAFVEALAAPEAADLTIEKLAGAYRVLLPHTAVTYLDHLGHASPISDGPTIRALRLVVSDQQDQWHEGEAVLQAQLRSDADVERAASHQLRLERLLVAAGGIAGSKWGGS
jgi:hypothetical protein